MDDIKSRLTPGYVNIIYEVILKSFRREQSVRSFLRSCNVPDRLLDSWKDYETNAEFIERLFPELLKNDRGREALLKVAKFLMYQKQFPDLEFLIDSDKRIEEAHKAVQKLKEYHWQQEEEIRNYQNSKKETKSSEEQFPQNQTTLKTLQEFNIRLVELSQKMDKENSRYLFQEWFFDLLDFFEVDNIRPYVKSGIEAEGKIFLNNNEYLIFLIFSLGRTSVVDIDKFYRKVIMNKTKRNQLSKGLIVSISGFSNLAIQEASGHKTPLILMDHNHIFYILSGIMGIKDMINRIDQHAVETGEAILPTSDFN